MKWTLVLGLPLTAALGLWLIPQGEDHLIPTVVASAAGTPDASARPGASGAVSTSGVHEGAAEAAGGEAITEIETITGANDGMALVGRRVDLHVDVQARAGTRAFWVGSRDNRVLVVIGRDDRGRAAHQRGAAAGHSISPVHGGQRAAIAGAIRPVPKLDERHAWQLTPEDEKELLDRKIYIRADTVRSEGHGSH